jgi:hypothetical protein
MVLYPLGFAVVLLLGGEETRPTRWVLIAVPLTFLAAASLVARRAQRARQ